MVLIGAGFMYMIRRRAIGSLQGPVPGRDGLQLVHNHLGRDIISKDFRLSSRCCSPSSSSSW
ncbi:hypothetical protein QJS66_00250 [Kocuria rhizophila]|nr:hypothetical protein QJS66_00250 [Kocuria rhizophila]